MDKLKAMHTFVRIAEHGSLTAAARALGASLPAVVRTLAALEAHLGMRLFNRTTRRISLTEEGRRYLASCRDELAAVELAEPKMAFTEIADAAIPPPIPAMAAKRVSGRALKLSFMQPSIAIRIALPQVAEFPM